MTTYYVLVCQECSRPDDPMAMPFPSARERGKWATEHTEATGHDTWTVLDQPTKEAP